MHELVFVCQQLHKVLAGWRFEVMLNWTLMEST